MIRFATLDAPSILGLKPTGVEQFPEALRAAGLQRGLHARNAGLVPPPDFNPNRDSETGVLNAAGLRTYAGQLAEAVTNVLKSGEFPVVLGGDCSNLIGCALALRRLGRFGLVFIDGHADFYQPEAEPNGEVASMDLAIVTGNGPNVLTNIDGLKPLLRAEDVVQIGMRDQAEQQEYGSLNIRDTAIHVFDFEQVRSMGVTEVANRAVERFKANQLENFWIHLDVDVLDDAIMSAVDYRLPGGLTWDELRTLLQVLIASGKAIGLNIGIFNPRLDTDGSMARRLVDVLVAGLGAQKAMGL